MKASPSSRKVLNPTMHGTRPYFDRRGSGNFLSPSSQHDPPFFSPSSIQAKLIVGQVNDKYEQEADVMAERVVRREKGSIDNTSSSPNIQSMCADCGEQEGKIQRTSADQDPEVMQTEPVLLQKKEDGTQNGSDALASELNATKGSGQPLAASTNQMMGESFGTDFNHVRVHTDDRASAMNQGLNARAFTHGSDIYFNKGQYNPETTDGKKLLAHELTHTVQQGHAGSQVQNKQASLRQEEGGNTSGSAENELNVAQAVSQVNGPRLQRSASWGAGSVHETINSATLGLYGSPAPITWMLLNGTQLTTEADATGAIKSPTLTTTNDAGTWKSKVTTVLDNVGSFDETVLSPGPWIRVVPKADVNARFGIAACTGAGDTTFQSKGDPSDAAVYAANRRHEDHHASDHQAAFNDIVKVWDTKVTKAKTDGTEFTGASAAEAEAKLWAAMGGTPAEIAKQFRNECLSRGGTYHGTAAGGMMTTTSKGSDATCTTSWRFVSNPS